MSTDKHWATVSAVLAKLAAEAPDDHDNKLVNLPPLVHPFFLFGVCGGEVRYSFYEPSHDKSGPPPKRKFLFLGRMSGGR